MTGRINLSKWHVFIIDDDASNAAVEADILRSFKANVYIALSGTDALAMITMPPQLTVIIVDVKMPEMSGWQLLKHFRAIPSVAKIPIIAVTACAMPGDRERILAAGFDGYIAKPVRLDSFWRELAEFIVRKHRM